MESIYFTWNMINMVKSISLITYIDGHSLQEAYSVRSLLKKEGSTQMVKKKDLIYQAELYPVIRPTGPFVIVCPQSLSRGLGPSIPGSTGPCLRPLVSRDKAGRGTNTKLVGTYGKL